MRFLPDLKQKGLGYYFAAAAALLGVILTVMYLIFGLSSSTFSAGIFICLLFAALAGVAAVFYEGFLTDFLVLGMGVLFAVSLGLLIGNSVGDFTEFLTPVGMYGDAANMPMRFVLAALLGIGIIVDILGCFLSRKKKI